MMLSLNDFNEHYEAISELIHLIQRFVWRRDATRCDATLEMKIVRPCIQRDKELERLFDSIFYRYSFETMLQDANLPSTFPSIICC